MFRGHGYNCVTMDGVAVEESDTFQCAHCNKTVFIKPSDPSPWCMNCDRQWCGQDKCKLCIPFMRKIEAEEAMCRHRMLLWRAADNV